MIVVDILIFSFYLQLVMWGELASKLRYYGYDYYGYGYSRCRPYRRYCCRIFWTLIGSSILLAFEAYEGYLFYTVDKFGVAQLIMLGVELFIAAMVILGVYLYKRHKDR
jgi:hypothetical protein